MKGTTVFGTTLISGRYLALTVNMTGATTTTMRVSSKIQAVFTAQLPVGQGKKIRAEFISTFLLKIVVTSLTDLMVLQNMLPQIISLSYTRYRDAITRMEMSL